MLRRLDLRHLDYYRLFIRLTQKRKSPKVSLGENYNKEFSLKSLFSVILRLIEPKNLICFKGNFALPRMTYVLAAPCNPYGLHGL